MNEIQDARTRGDVFVFLSHQWLGFDEPDPQGIQLVAMKRAVRDCASHANVALDRVRVWVDVVSVPQLNSSEQRLAIASLPTFASAGQYFVVVAPDAEHVDTGSVCNSLTYRRRAWCRAEIFSCWARNGTKSMYESTRQGLRSLASDDQVLLEALDVFGGAMTCCPVWKSTSVSGAPDNSSLSHFSAMTRPTWLGRAARNRHRHAIEQASRRWRGG